MREPQDAEDLTQEVFLRLMRRDEAAPVDNPEIYVFRIAANLLRDRARRAASHPAAEHTSLEDLVEATTEARTIEAALQEDRGPERVLLSQEAELGAAFLCADLGLSLTPREDHAGYIAHWLEVLKNDKRFIVSAASHAQKACEFLHQLQPQASCAA